MQRLKNSIIAGLVAVILCAGVLGYDNYKAHEQIVELETKAEVLEDHLIRYIQSYMSCTKFLKEVLKEEQ